jgi:transcriptional regulator with XRE-family HTH domain
MLSAAQIRAARALLDWNRADLAEATGLTVDALHRIERGVGRPLASSTQKLMGAFAAAGVQFTDNDGVRLQNELFRLIEGETAYIDLLDDAFHDLQGLEGEILFFYIDNELSSQAVVDTSFRLRHNGIKFRSLIDESKPYCVYPLKEYRCIPHIHFHNNPILVYGDKVGVFIDTKQIDGTNHMKCHLTKNNSYANAMRKIFDELWYTHKMPTETIAPVTYE